MKVAQSDAHQDVCDILLQYIQQGAKVTTPQQEESESTQEEETKAELAEVYGGSWRYTGIEYQLMSFSLIQEPKEWDTQQESAKVKSPQEGEDDDSQRLPEVREHVAMYVWTMMWILYSLGYPAEEKRQ